MESKGVVISAYNKRGYAYAAYNFAFSLKENSPEIEITIIHDGILSELQPYQYGVFNNIIELDEKTKEKLKGGDGMIDPAMFKVGIYDLLPYEYNLFLDVDALCVAPIEPIFDELIKDGSYFYVYTMGLHTIDQGDTIPGMGWAFASQIWSHYNLKEEDILPAPNTSFQFIVKCDLSKELYEQIKKNIDNPIPVDDLRYKWGGGQPDELYLSVALAQKGITGKTPRDYMFMTHAASALTFDQIYDSYPIMCFWGNKNMARPMYTEHYDRVLIKAHSAKMMRHIYKWSTIKNDKYANNKTVKVSPAKMREIELEKVLLPIEQSVQIDHSKLIQGYPDVTGKNIRVTNWLNCSFIYHRGKNYFAYRMESAPFCTRMKIGLCLLDANYQPIKESNVLPILYSNLKSATLQGNKSFPIGYHVEDPRLFVFNDQLYLSYTDGYQMAQAKINEETLQAEESFYIDKPNPRLTEKNWTFFENENKLYCSYSLHPHVILEMNGDKWTEVAKMEYDIDWKWGTLRGGTSPVKHGDNYISFFHSAKSMNYKGQTGRQYFAGAIIFEGKFPFAPISISKEPLFAGEHCSDAIPRLSNRIFVVFPSGAIRKENSLVVSFGYNDMECRFMEITDEVLKDNLVEIKQKEFA